MSTDKNGKQTEWDDLRSVFEAMEGCGRFLILRNFEELSDDSIYMEGHDDIDFLCDDAAAVRKALDVRKDVCWRSPCHYYIRIKDKDIKIGLRFLGDGYYDKAWEESMLSRRKDLGGGMYVMDEENYFYSLLYHALVQKKSLSDDYRRRLKKMAAALGMELKGLKDCYQLLFDFMGANGYHMIYPKDPTVPINDRYVKPELRKGYLEWRMRRILFTPRVMMKYFQKK